TTVPPIVIGGWTVRTDRQFYYLLRVVWLAAGACAANLVRSRIGLAFMAVRDRDYAAQVLGLDLLYYKALAFGIAAGYAGIAGSLWAHYNRLITTEQVNIGASIDYVAMIVVGGLTSGWGPHLGYALGWSLTQALYILLSVGLAVL